MTAGDGPRAAAAEFNAAPAWRRAISPSRRTGSPERNTILYGAGTGWFDRLLSSGGTANLPLFLACAPYGHWLDAVRSTFWVSRGSTADQSQSAAAELAEPILAGRSCRALLIATWAGRIQAQAACRSRRCDSYGCQQPFTSSHSPSSPSSQRPSTLTSLTGLSSADNAINAPATRASEVSSSAESGRPERPSMNRTAMSIFARFELCSLLPAGTQAERPWPG